MRERRGIYWVLVGKPEGNRLRGRPGVNGGKILRWIFRKWVVGYELDRAGSGYGEVAGTCECGNEPSGSMKCGEFLDWLRTG